MTATVGGKARVLGIGNPFFDPDWPKLSILGKELVRQKCGYAGTDCWWGDYPGERQLFHVPDASGPRLRVKIYPSAVGVCFQDVHIVDKREFTVDGQRLYSVTVPSWRPSQHLYVPWYIRIFIRLLDDLVAQYRF